jgi:glycosyltransferase involved in cell wall biosynthesis
LGSLSHETFCLIYYTAQLKKILLIENFGSDFYQARLSFAKFLKDKGFDVYALVPNDNYALLIEEAGIKTFTYEFSRKNKGPLQLLALAKIFNGIIKKNEIDIVHSYRFQPNLLNVLSNIFSKRKVVLHVTGLGLAFSNTSFKYMLLRFVSQIIFQFKFMIADTVIFQNNDDFDDLWFTKLWKRKAKVVEGSGVDISLFENSNQNQTALRREMDVSDNELLFICTTRLLWEKGIKEMIEAFEILQKDNFPVKLWIIGWSDQDNPRHVEQSYIDQFSNHKGIRFLGKRADVKQLLEAADVFLYPSYYREGIPRAILEALAMGVPIITTKMPGCNLTVIANKNGFLIEPKSVSAIIDHVKQIANKDLHQLGKQSRILAETKFSKEIIFQKILNLYH